MYTLDEGRSKPNYCDDCTATFRKVFMGSTLSLFTINPAKLSNWAVE